MPYCSLKSLNLLQSEIDDFFRNHASSVSLCFFWKILRVSSIMTILTDRLTDRPRYIVTSLHGYKNMFRYQPLILKGLNRYLKGYYFTVCKVKISLGDITSSASKRWPRFKFRHIFLVWTSDMLIMPFKSMEALFIHS